MRSLRRDVHLCPHVPTAAKVQAFKASSTLASSNTTVALFPPSSRIVFPNLFPTYCWTIFPILDEPVKDKSPTLLSLVIAIPISAPPWIVVRTAGLILFFLNTSWMMLVVAMVTKDVVGAPFQTKRFPQTKAIAAFHANTAQGKLKAEIIPTTPIGFQTYIMK